jgi:hypothetical protein
MCLVARGQDVELPSPATTLPTTQRARHVAQIPPGFQKVEVEGRTALAEPADASWVRKQLEAMKPTSRPSVVGDMLSQTKSQKGALVKALAQDLDADPKALANAYDADVIEQLQKMYDLHPAILYLVTSREKVKELLLNGWKDPNFYYNRIADATVVSGNVAIRTDGQMDDAVVPALYPAKATNDQKLKALTDAVAQSEGDLVKFLDARAKPAVSSGLATMVHNVAMKDLTFTDDQRWFALGAPIVVAAKYSGPLTGNPELLKAMTQDNPQNPLRFTSIDLLHPPAINSMNPEAIPFYFDTARRKSAAAIAHLIDQAGPGAIGKILTAIRAQKPADGPALVKLIQDQTGVDLTKDLSR